jgi:hypothetical protein
MSFGTVRGATQESGLNIDKSDVLRDSGNLYFGQDILAFILSLLPSFFPSFLPSYISFFLSFFLPSSTGV